MLSHSKELHFYSYVDALPLCMSVYHVCVVPEEPRKGIGSPGIRIIDSWTPCE